MKVYRTSDVAKIIGVHNNTILAYEKSGYISNVERSEVSKEIGVSMDVIINWERNGLLEVPRNNKNNYRIYSEDEIILLKTIKLIRKENYSTQCIGKMIRKIEANDFEFLHRENELLSPIGDRQKDMENLICHLNKMKED